MKSKIMVTRKQTAQFKLQEIDYLQCPAPQGGGMVKESYLRYYHAIYKHYDTIIHSWDLAIKETTRADFTVGQVWGVKGPNVFLLDMVRKKMGSLEQIEAIWTLRNKYPMTRAVLIEQAMTGNAIKEMLERKIPGIIGIKPSEFGGDKEQRLIASLPDFEAGNVYLPDPTRAPWVKVMIEELLLFPKAAHDDCLDACTQALNWLARKGRIIHVEPTVSQANYQHSAEYARSIYSDQQSRVSPKEIRAIFGG